MLLDKHRQQGISIVLWQEILGGQSIQLEIFLLLLILVQLIAHTILNVVVDNEVEFFFCKAVMLR